MSEQKEKKNGKANYKLIAIVAGILLLLFLGIVLIVGIVLAVVLLGNKSDSGSSQSGGLFGGTEESSGSYWDESIRVGDVVEFGTYEQDGDTGNGAEPIEWVVVDKDGDNYCLISRYVLDCQPYDDGTGQNSDSSGLAHEGLVYYENAYIRKWINDSFVPEAFGDKEMQYILPVSVKEDGITAINDNSYATDYAFVPSYSEIEAFFGEAGWLGTNGQWICPPTSYAKGEGCTYVTSMDLLDSWNSVQPESMQFTSEAIYNPSCFETITQGATDEDYMMQGEFAVYWVRDRVYDQQVAADNSFVVLADGALGYKAMYYSYGVRPAIYVTITNPTDSEGEMSEGQPAKDFLKAYSGTTYYTKENENGQQESMWIDAAQIHFYICSYGLTNDIEEASYHGIYKCFDGSFDIRNFTYYEMDGKEYFVSESDYFKLMYDPDEQKWTTYSNSPSVIAAAEKYGMSGNGGAMGYEYHSEEDIYDEDGWVILFEYY